MIAEEMDNRIITFGCRLNAYESEAIKKAVSDSLQKNLIIFNSCAVTSQAEQQLRQAVRKARRENPQAKIVVTGCAAQINPERYAQMVEVDLVLGNQEKTRVESYHEKRGQTPSTLKRGLTPFFKLSHPDKLFLATKNSTKDFLTIEEAAKIKVNDIMSLTETAPQMVSYFDNRTRAFLEIQNGCNHRCTFCIIPFGRGNSRSVLFGDIVAQTRKMIAMGHKEIVLTGVDISDYGKDLELKITLSQMIKRLLALVPELPRLRLSSIDVAEIDDGFWDLIANEPRFMPYFHLSIQSGDDMILKRMKRRHTCWQVIDFCQKARKLRPEITFGADIIAGFPTETNEMFENSLNLIEEADIIFTHIFPYSKREGTPAAKMPPVKGDIIKNRAKLLREKGKAQLQKYLQ
ncbi:MAG TPA: tRNA (N(6)-L-threonylcarbamoyladenosine(37)-C(2))-methylthiotransferase MtaB, partial [Rickettsiales bacterium]|nr:tRNA (N(6)-L-threonylcarbamoyladenosine(37)-C(2))-methylthiotransferase MtaB [Rickettsiales bacterium]